MVAPSAVKLPFVTNKVNDTEKKPQGKIKDFEYKVTECIRVSRYQQTAPVRLSEDKQRFANDNNGLMVCKRASHSSRTVYSESTSIEYRPNQLICLHVDLKNNIAKRSLSRRNRKV